MKKSLLITLASVPLLMSQPLIAEQLYDRDNWANMAADNRAHEVGDIVTVVIFESASATNRVGTRSGKDTSLNGNFGAGGIDESLSFGIGSTYRGIGETERSDRFAASMAAHIVEVLPNGDFIIEGAQYMLVNGEHRDIEVRGQIRPIDISPDNTVISTRLANAEINYDGEGFATRSAKPGLLNRIFSFLGL
ncbi:flagellar basal body L-ring protein FlgH [uncultured Erythrobacter sp.]|uniref:flagellar basal body L-ring protein FlgH n=1 Tax=uncultured Erythrobacter sp. TaxID=263913 RepID=UPI002622E253|nr:flagellar basal body L-ring protein FlgH [uncultured Erythrobacter sp.]